MGGQHVVVVTAAERRLGRDRRNPAAVVRPGAVPDREVVVLAVGLAGGLVEFHRHAAATVIEGFELDEDIGAVHVGRVDGPDDVDVVAV
jgi:hypothetical protein